LVKKIILHLSFSVPSMNHPHFFEVFSSGFDSGEEK